MMKGSIDINLLVVIFWMIWEKRNSDRVDDCYLDLQALRTKAMLFLHDTPTTPSFVNWE